MAFLLPVSVTTIALAVLTRFCGDLLLGRIGPHLALFFSVLQLTEPFVLVYDC
jgi:hypothetical protein